LPKSNLKLKEIHNLLVNIENDRERDRLYKEYEEIFTEDEQARFDTIARNSVVEIILMHKQCGEHGWARLRELQLKDGDGLPLSKAEKLELSRLEYEFIIKPDGGGPKRQ